MDPKHDEIVDRRREDPQLHVAAQTEERVVHHRGGARSLRFRFRLRQVRVADQSLGDRDRVEEDSAHEQTLGGDETPETPLHRSAAAALFALAATRRVDVAVRAARQLAASGDAKRASDCLPAGMMRRARRKAVVRVEREVRPLFAWLDVVDVEDAGAAAAEKAADGAAVTVANANASAEIPPLGRGEEVIRIHRASSRIMPAQTRV